MLEIVRDAPLGQVIRVISRNKLLRYPEERPDFELPAQYVSLLNNGLEEKSQDEDTTTSDQLDSQNDISPKHQSPNEPNLDLETARTITSTQTTPYSNERLQAEHIHSLARTKSLPIVPQKTTDGIILVDWYTTDDSSNPQNCKQHWFFILVHPDHLQFYLMHSILLHTHPKEEIRHPKPS
jgi:DHA1 family multidrug resistance protein-like MFS transporter